MSRLRAETMPAVTVPPRLNGLPMAMTHSPSRSLLGIAELHRFERLVGMHAQEREVGLGVLADQIGLELGAVIENDADLVGVGDHVIVGDDQPGRIDDEAGAERIDATRRLVRIVALAVVVLEELVEELFHRRARRQIGQLVGARVDFLRCRNVDDGVDDLLGDVGDGVRTARRRRSRRHEHGGGRERDNRRAMPDRSRKAAGRKLADTEHGRQRSWLLRHGLHVKAAWL